MATGTITKVAWIHDGQPGARSLGHFDCPCGAVVAGVEYAGPELNPCGNCDRVFDGKGWVV